MKVCVFLFLAAASILYRFQWGLVLDLLIAVSRKLICRCYKYARFIYFICFFLPRSLFSLLGTFHLPVWCLLFFFFFYVTILIVTIQVKPLNYVGLFLCFGQVQPCSPGASPGIRVLSLLLQIEKPGEFRRQLLSVGTSVETMHSQTQTFQ